MKMLRSVIDWLEHRTGIESAINHFLYEDMPAAPRDGIKFWEAWRYSRF